MNEALPEIRSQIEAIKAELESARTLAVLRVELEACKRMLAKAPDQIRREALVAVRRRKSVSRPSLEVTYEYAPLNVGYKR
jgi:hypothetical protein